MTTLADLAPEQRAECVGMWADYRITPVVITSIYWHKYVQDWVADIFDPAEGWEENEIHLSAITPRYDLPRVWNADGTPARDRTTNLEEIADAYRNHCLANGDDNTVAWIDRKRGELDAD